MPVLCQINWSEFKKKCNELFNEETAKKILKLIDECEYEPDENDAYE